MITRIQHETEDDFRQEHADQLIENAFASAAKVGPLAPVQPIFDSEIVEDTVEELYSKANAALVAQSKRS